MSDRTFSPPPPITVTIAGHTLALRFVDRVTVDGDEWRHGWADVARGELSLSLAIDDRLGHLPTLIGGAIIEAMFQLCPGYGVHAADVGNALDPDVYLDGPDYRAWLKRGIVGTLAEVSAATWPAVRQRPDGWWVCPFCPATFPPLEYPVNNWNPAAPFHVAETHGVAQRCVRAVPYRPRLAAGQEGGRHA